MDLSGAFTALATPFSASGDVDDAALVRLVEYQIEGRISGIVVCGTTGETPTLSRAEREALVARVVEIVDGRCPVIAGAGGNDTARVVDEARAIADLGVAALLSVSPYYNRPNQEGLVRHFRAVADGAGCPMILYNVPGRTGGNIDSATAHELARHPNVLGIKEASGRIASFQALLTDAPDGFVVLSGDDALTFPAMCLGADGVISVASNLDPGRVQRLTEAASAGDLRRARELHFELSPLFDACFLDTNPVPVKAGLALLGLADDRLRLPLVPAGGAVRDEMARCLRALNHDLVGPQPFDSAVAV